MLTPAEFRDAVDVFCREWRLWVTSGRRTDAHSLSIGGFRGDPHSWGAGVDVQPLSLNDTTRQQQQDRAGQLGLRLLFEDSQSHIHIQPSGWPPGPVVVAPDPAWDGLHVG